MIIDSLKSYKNGLSLQEISETTSISKTTAHRICNTLVELEILCKDSSTKYYRLGNKFLEWFFAFKDYFSTYDEVKRILKSISNKIGETDEKLRYSIEIGEKLPLHRGAGGKVILSYLSKDELEKFFNYTDITESEKPKLLKDLEKIRQDGYYISFGERDPYIAAFSTPLFDNNGNIYGSLSVSGPINRFRKKFKNDIHIEFVKSKALLVQSLIIEK